MSSKDYVIVKDGELVHFKYIKREKVNGEWRYYYDRGSISKSIKKAVGVEARDAYRTARDAAVTAENAHKEAYANKQKETAEANTARDAAETVSKNTPTVSEADLKKLQDNYVQATEAAVTAKKELAAAQKGGPEYQSPAMKLARTKLARDKLTKAEKLAEQAKTEYNNAFKASQAVKKANNESATQTKEAAEATAKNNEAAKKSVEAQKNAQEALKKYYKTPLGSLKFLSDKGKELLYKIF